MVTRQGREIEASVGERSGTLLHGRRVTVHDNVLTFTHPVYERFLDMKVIDGKKHKRVRIHNRFVYGTYSSLAERLMYGYTDDLNEAISSGKP